MDAAVATALALAVTFPQAGNLGGGGFLLYAPTNGTPRFLDYRETAPQHIRAELFLDRGARDESRATRGGLPVATPGTVAGLAEALAQHGSWSWERVVAPSIELARRGVWLTTRQARYLDLYTEQFASFPSTAKIFLPGGNAMLPGECFVQPELAATFERLAKHGPREFYEGETAQRIVSTVQACGGVLDDHDLAAYAPVWREPIERAFNGKRVIVPSLPSSGGMVLLSCLGLFEAEGLGVTEVGTIERYLAYARVMKIAFRLRAALLGDPRQVSSDAHELAVELAARPFRRGDLARLEHSLERDLPTPPTSEQNTTHLCVIDPAGNAVSNTYSLNTIFGAKLVVDGGGFFLNNTIDDFSLADGAPNWYELSDGKQNELEPGKRPVSSMTPTLILSDPNDTASGMAGHLEMVLGGSGGPRIPTMLFQIAQAVLGDRIPLDEAVRQPRVHHQHLPHEVAVEERMSEKLRAGLAAAVSANASANNRQPEPLAQTPILGIACALHIDRTKDEGPLSAVLDSRFALV